MTYPFPPLVDLDPDVLAARLSDTLGRAWEELEAKRLAVLASANDLRRAETLARVAELQTSTRAFQAIVEREAKDYSTRVLPAVYGQGAVEAGLRVGSAAEPFSWSQFHVDAAQSLAADSYADFLARSQEAGRTSEAFAREVRAVARERTAFAVTGDRTAQQVGRELADRLEAKGLSVVTYADGSTRSMRYYTDMAVRTKTAVAHNVGALGRYGELGVTFVELFDGAECGLARHEDDRKANGLVVDLATAAAYPISHPNCRRGIGARPDVKTAKEAREAAPSTTAAQRADQAEEEQRRAGRLGPSPSPRRSQAARSARAARRAARTAPAAVDEWRTIDPTPLIDAEFATMRAALPSLPPEALRSMVEEGFAGLDLVAKGRVRVQYDRAAGLSPAQRQQVLDDVDFIVGRQPPPGDADVVFTIGERSFRAESAQVQGLTLRSTYDVSIRPTVYTDGVRYLDTLMPSAAANPPRYIVSHEYGHAVDRGSLDATYDAVVDELWKAHRTWHSPYGKTDPTEAYAEHFAEWALTDGQTINAGTRAYAERFGWRRPEPAPAPAAASRVDPLRDVDLDALDEDDLASLLIRDDVAGDDAAVERVVAALDAAEARALAEAAKPRPVAELLRTTSRTAEEEQVVRDYFRALDAADDAAKTVGAALPPKRASVQGQRADDWELVMEAEVRLAEGATKGNLLNRDGLSRGITERMLWDLPARDAVRFASEELLRYWEAGGIRTPISSYITPGRAGRNRDAFAKALQGAIDRNRRLREGRQ